MMRIALTACLWVIVGTQISCSVPGFIAANVFPEKKIDAVCKPINQKTLVFVDDPRRTLSTPQLARLIAQQVMMDLKEENAIEEFISQTDLYHVRTKEPDFDSWPIDRIGKAAGAHQVIYILIDAFDVTGASQQMRRPTALARVKIVDVQTGRRLFPSSDELRVTSQLSFRQPSPDASTAMRNGGGERKLAILLGGDIARKFYKHEPRKIGSGFED